MTGRLIDADALIEDIRQHSESYFADDFAHEWVDRQPTVEAIPVEFIKSEIKENKGFYNSNLRRLLDVWAERKEE